MMGPALFLATILAGCTHDATGQPDDLDGDGFTIDDDCNDDDDAIHPGADELCDAVDNDCDGTIDVGAIDATSWYADADADTFGAGATVLACEAPAGTVASAYDCDDGNPAIHPGATEICDALDADEDCDSLADDADDSVDPTTATMYADADGDTYGDASACDGSAVAGDCDDSNGAIHPGVTEVCDGADNDCDGTTDVGAVDALASYADADGDAYGTGTPTFSCSAAAGTATNGDDCDDTDGSVNPAATEICDVFDVDEDCDSFADDEDDSVDPTTATMFADADGDHYGDPSAVRCGGTWSVANGEDCDDTTAAAHPGATEVCDGGDNDCDGTTDVDAVDAVAFYTDADGDDYGVGAPTVSCTAIPGGARNADDCDDTNAAINPGAQEVCDPLHADEDCDSLADEADDSVDPLTAVSWADADGDGFGDPSAFRCDVASGYVADAGDCDDANDEVHPGVDEICADRLDNDCDGTSDCHWGGDLDPSDASATIAGTDPAMSFGATVGDAGDVNGDGSADLIVGTNADSGYGFLFTGPITSTTADAATASITSGPDEWLGWDFEGIGDPDGDGYDDLVAPAWGRVYVIAGPITGAAPAADLAIATITDPDSDMLGLAPASGDLNGDGTPDVVFGDPYADSGRGVAYVYYGPIAGDDLGPDDADASVRGESESWEEVWGSMVGGWNEANGDIDGDGIDDLLVSTWAQYGSATLFYGPISGAVAQSAGDVFVTGAGWEDGFAFYTAIGGDLDDDGLDDVAITALDGNNGRGTLYVFSASSIAGRSDLSPGVADARFSGDDEDARLGYMLDTDGDFDADGNDDLVTTSGQTAIGFYGPVSGTFMASDAAFTVSTPLYRSAVGFVGDVSDDGIDDLGIGAWYSPGGTLDDAGAVYLFFGRAF